MRRERAQDLVDDVVRRAEQGAARAGRGVREAIPDLRVATREDVRRLSAKIDRLSARVSQLEGKPAKRATGKTARTASASRRSGVSRRRKT